MNKYKLIGKSEFILNEYSLVPIRMDDREAIRKWRNQQIEILRQRKEITTEEQDKYFNTVVTNLFVDTQPSQFLFSFLKNNKLIGYGGLVHIDWDSKNAEISFLWDTERNIVESTFLFEWDIYWTLIKEVTFNSLKFKKIYTYGYDIRPHLTKVLLKQNFVEEANLKRHVKKNEVYVDVLIHSFFIEQYK